MIHDSLIWVTICFHFSKGQLAALYVLSILTWSVWWLQFSCDTWMDWMLLLHRSYTRFCRSFWSFSFLFLDMPIQFWISYVLLPSHPSFLTFLFPFFMYMDLTCLFLVDTCLHIPFLSACTKSVSVVLEFVGFHLMILSWHELTIWSFFLRWIFPLFVPRLGSLILYSNYSST